MIDTSIIDDKTLLEDAIKMRRERRRAYDREWRRNFKEKYGVSYDTYLLMKKAKAERDEERYPPGVLRHR